MYQRAITQNFHGLPSSKLTIEYYRYGMNMEHSEKNQKLSQLQTRMGISISTFPFPWDISRNLGSGGARPGGSGPITSVGRGDPGLWRDLAGHGGEVQRCWDGKPSNPGDPLGMSP